MAFTFAALRAGIAAALEAVDGLNVYAVGPSSVQSPAAVVLTGDPYWTRDQAMGRGMATVKYDVALLLRYPNVDAGQVNLDALLDDVVTALLDDRTLGGACDDLAVPEVTGFDEVEVGGTPLLGARVRVELLVNET